MSIELAQNAHGLALCLTVEDAALPRVFLASGLWSRFEVDGHRLVLGSHFGSSVLLSVAYFAVRGGAFATVDRGCLPLALRTHFNFRAGDSSREILALEQLEDGFVPRLRVDWRADLADTTLEVGGIAVQRPVNTTATESMTTQEEKRNVYYHIERAATARTSSRLNLAVAR